jgi:UDP-N-acetylmuramoyl-L-alanyl-D-glutamate--2,6-diaminopimelate ligase
MSNFIKSLIPESLLKTIRPVYHGLMAKLGNIYFGRPSQKMLVIGVTGTNGKTTTVNLIAHILEESGLKTGFTSTAVVNIDGSERLNKMKMTMPSGWLLQKWMSQMVKTGCKCAVVEVSSEGLAQNRHLGINFDIAVFTNLTPEHLESHGGFENYKLAKARLFQSLASAQKKSKAILGMDSKEQLQKIIVINIDDDNGKFFSDFKADKYFTYGVKNPADFQATNILYSPEGVSFNLQSLIFNLHLKGQFDVYNSLAAISTAQSLGIDLAFCKHALEKIEVVPGRVEVIHNSPFTVVVDYAYEPEEMRQLYETVTRWPHKKVIQVLGPTGGGRDQARIPLLGKMAGEFADIVVLTIDDPYDDDPRELAQRMEDGVIISGKIKDRDFFLNLDRRQAFVKAFKFAQPGDLVLITGKGADQKMALANGKYIDWDDRKIAKEELGYLQMQNSKTFNAN